MNPSLYGMSTAQPSKSRTGVFSRFRQHTICCSHRQCRTLPKWAGFLRTSLPTYDSVQLSTDSVSLVATKQICTGEIFYSTLGRDSHYPDPRVSLFSSVPPCKFQDTMTDDFQILSNLSLPNRPIIDAISLIY